RAKGAPRRIGKRGVGCEKISRQPGIGIIAFTRAPFAIGTIVKIHALLWEKAANSAARAGGEIAAGKRTQTLIQTDDAELLIMNEDGIADGIKGICPLAMHTVQLFEQADILQG